MAHRDEFCGGWRRSLRAAGRNPLLAARPNTPIRVPSSPREAKREYSRPDGLTANPAARLLSAHARRWENSNGLGIVNYDIYDRKVLRSEKTRPQGTIYRIPGYAALIDHPYSSRPLDYLLILISGTEELSWLSARKNRADNLGRDHSRLAVRSRIPSVISAPSPGTIYAGIHRSRTST